MGLNIKVDLRSTGLGHKSTSAETQRYQRAVLGGTGDRCRPGRWRVDRGLNESGVRASDTIQCVDGGKTPAPNLRNISIHSTCILIRKEVPIVELLNPEVDLRLSDFTWSQNND